jgi:glycosyltransferase involved in cell wall biosynthesis
VLPAHNEEAGIERAVTSAAAFAGVYVGKYEIIVVDDGSTDGTAARLRGLQPGLSELKVLTNEINEGYGAALVRGFEAAEYEWIFTTDSDNQFDINELTHFLPFVGAYDFLMGYRKNRQDSFTRKFLAWGFNLLVDWVFRMNVKDVDCAFKLIRRSVLGRMTLTSRDFFIDTEIIARARRLGCRIYQRAVTHYPRTAGETTIRPSNIPRTLREMARIYRELQKTRSQGEVS